MHWAERMAREIIEKYPNEEVYTCASGISPSGSVHIGNFREIITTYFVVRALQNLGKQTRFIFSWDDYDRFRKVPKNIDPSFEQYIGLPYSDIPDPYGCHGSYAEHFQSEFEEALARFDIDVEFIYQNKEYRSGRYNSQILYALQNRREIYDILMSFKTQASSEEARESFYPIGLYCESCGRDNTRILGSSQDERFIEYECTCGHRAELNVLESRCIKLNWKIDWPMRWQVENVIFEPGGRDHSSETGSYNVSKQIVNQVFGFHAPEYVAYEFIGIKGGGSKMSSSSGNVLTPGDLLNVYTPEVLMFIFSKYQPGAAFNIGLDNDVNRNFSEYERYRTMLENGTLDNDDVAYALSLAQVGAGDQNLPKFGQIAGILPLINYDHDLLTDVLSRSGEIYSSKDIEMISTRAQYWIQEYFQEKDIRVNENMNVEYLRTLISDDKEWLGSFCRVLDDAGELSEEALMRRVYDICYDEDAKIKRSNQKRLFKHIYNLVLGQNNGPRIPLLIEAVGAQRCRSLIMPKAF
jgi:lysyl-tRNA synthetase class 1